MGQPVAGQFLIFVRGDEDEIIRVQEGFSRKGVTDANGDFDQELFDGIEFAFIQYGWDTTIHDIPQKFINWLVPVGGFDIKLQAILDLIDTGSPADIGQKVTQIKTKVDTL